MSSYWSAYYGTALVLNEDEFTQFLEKYTQIRNLTEPFERPHIDQLFEDCPIQEYDFIRSCCKKETPVIPDDCFYVTPILENETDGVWFAPFIHPDGEHWNISSKNVTAYLSDQNTKVIDCYADITRGDNLYAIFADYSMDSPLQWIHRPYPTYNSLVNEFKKKMEHYLPKDFNWNAHIGRISYAAYA